MSQNHPVIVEQTFMTSTDKLWAALTDVHRMRQWFFPNIPDFKPEKGFATQFEVQSGHRDFLHQWKVTEVKPREKLILSWTYDGYQGQSRVTFEILPEGNQVRLRLIHQGWENFPQDIPEFRRESCLEGWQYLIKKSLYQWLQENK